MSDPSPSEQARRTRRRWISFGETVGVLALVISALGLWLSWKSGERPTSVVEQRQPIALILRGKAEADGRTLAISPVEPSHALQSLAIALGGSTINVGSDGELAANDVERALGTANRDKANHRVRVRIQAEYVEAGVTRRSSGSYSLAYRWEGGGLFGGRSLRLIGLSR